MQTTIRTDGAASTAALLSSQQTLSAASTAANTSLSQVSSVSVSLVGNQAPLNTQPVSMPPLRQAEEEFNHAIMRAAQYEGSIENLVRDKVNAQFPTTALGIPTIRRLPESARTPAIGNRRAGRSQQRRDAGFYRRRL